MSHAHHLPPGFKELPRSLESKTGKYGQTWNAIGAWRRAGFPGFDKKPAAVPLLRSNGQDGPLRTDG